MTLFDERRHGPLSEQSWDEQFARAASDRIIADTQAAFLQRDLWPLHPLDRSDERPGVRNPLYYGAAGVGWALGRLYRRTGDDCWLERARRFAMHAIDQCDRALAEHGQRKFSLWTGDLGLALYYLRDCIEGTADFPTLDVF